MCELEEQSCENASAQQNGKMRSKATAHSSGSGARLPVNRVFRLFRKSNYAEQLSAFVPVYMAGVMEYLRAGVLQLTANAAPGTRSAAVAAPQPQPAASEDELSELLGKVSVAQGGVVSEKSGSCRGGQSE